jgi:hypothetical protein
VPIVLKSGSLNLLEPSGSVKACNGIALPYWCGTNSLVFTLCVIRRITKFQQCALICTILIFHVLAPKCFGSSLPSSGSFLDPPKLLEIQVEWAVYHIMCHDTPAHRSRNHTLYDTPPIRFVFQVTQEDLRNSLMMAGYCRNM